MADSPEKRDNNQTTRLTPTHFTQLKVMKNATIMCITFFLTFLAYDCLSMLQSTLNHENGIGVICQATLYGCYCVSSLLLPKYTIKKLGCKITLVLSMFLYLPYIASNLYPHWSLMIPAAAINGFAASLLWGAQCQYFNEIAILYNNETLMRVEKRNKASEVRSKDSKNSIAENPDMQKACDFKCHSNIYVLKTDAYQSSERYISKKVVESSSATSSISYNFINSSDRKLNADSHTISKDDSHSTKSGILPLKILDKSDSDHLPHKDVQSITARFFGMHAMAYLSTHMLSNLMSYFILQNDVSRSNISLSSSCVCGAQFCNEESDCFVHNLQEPSQERKDVLLGVCVSLGLVSIMILALFLDPLNDRNQKVKFTLDFLLATLKQLKKMMQIFITPISFYVGMIQGFYTGDFNLSFVGCAWGTYHVGLVTACYGAACAFSPLSSFLVKYIGRVPIILFAAVASLIAEVLLLIWVPNAETPALFFVLAGLLGTSVGILWSQVKAMYGFLFSNNQEAAFGAYHVWYSLGFCLSFAYSNHLCTYVKIHALMCVLILGVIGYLCLEIALRRQIKKSVK